MFTEHLLCARHWLSHGNSGMRSGASLGSADPSLHTNTHFFIYLPRATLGQAPAGHRRGGIRGCSNSASLVFTHLPSLPICIQLALSSGNCTGPGTRQSRV